MAFNAHVFLCVSLVALLYIGAALAKESSGPQRQRQQQKSPLLHAFIYDNSNARLAWLTDPDASNLTAITSRTEPVDFLRGHWSRNGTLFQQSVQPRAPIALSVGTRLITANGTGLCEYDMASNGALLRFVQLPETPTDIVHLPQGPSGQTEQLLVVLSSALRIGAIDYTNFIYVGTWLSIQEPNVSIEYEPASDTLLAAYESQNVVRRYSRVDGSLMGDWVRVPRPRYISVLPYANETYVLSAEADSCELYTFRTEDAVSLGVSASSNWCDRPRKSYSFGVDDGKAYLLSMGALSTRSVFDGMTRDSGAQPTLGSIAALARADDDTGALGMVDAYSWRSSIADQPEPLAACGALGSGATLSSGVKAIFLCPQHPGRLIVVDSQSAYALYRNDDGGYCFERHLYVPSAPISFEVSYSAVLDELYVAADVKLVGVCADHSIIAPQPYGNSISSAPCTIQPNATWCAGDFSAGARVVYVNGTLAGYSSDAPLALSTSAGQLFGAFKGATEVQVTLRWFRPLDKNFTRGEWTDVDTLSVSGASPLVLAVDAYATAHPDNATNGGGASRPIWVWILVGCLVGLMILVCITLIVGAVVRRRKHRRYQQSDTLSTDWNQSEDGLLKSSNGEHEEDNKPCFSLRKLIRRLFCSCACCWDRLPPGKLKCCSSCLGGYRKQSVRPYRQLELLGGDQGDGQAAAPPPQTSFSLADDHDPARVTPGVLAPVDATPQPGLLPPAKSDSFTGGSPFTSVPLYGGDPHNKDL